MIYVQYIYIYVMSNEKGTTYNLGLNMMKTLILAVQQRNKHSSSMPLKHQTQDSTLVYTFIPTPTPH